MNTFSAIGAVLVAGAIEKSLTQFLILRSMHSSGEENKKLIKIVQHDARELGDYKEKVQESHLTLLINGSTGGI